MTQTWDPSHSTPTVAGLTNGNLTYTKLSGTTHATAYGAVAVPTGKYYWEVVIAGTGIASETSGVGIGIGASGVVVSTDWVGGAANSLGWYGTGNIWTNAAHSITWATYATGNRLCFAMDVGGGLIWGRVANGNWNNSGTANPATGTLGTAIPAAILAAAIEPGVTLASTTTPDSCVASFASGSWSFTAPSGFISFDTTGVFNPTSLVRQLGPILAQ